MGVNKLNGLMKNMAIKAGLDCQRLTNHSAPKKLPVGGALYIRDPLVITEGTRKLWDMLT